MHHECCALRRRRTQDTGALCTISATTTAQVRIPDTLSSRFGIQCPIRSINHLSVGGDSSQMSIIDTTSSGSDLDNEFMTIDQAAVAASMPGHRPAKDPQAAAGYIVPPHSDPGARQRLGPPPGLGVSSAPWPSPAPAADESPGRRPAAAPSLASATLAYASREGAEGGGGAPPPHQPSRQGPAPAMFGGGGSSAGNGQAIFGGGLRETGAPGRTGGPIEMAVGNADEDVMKKFLSKFNS
mmetsp:Transcript_18099/g.47799  ORF Transcript_18099/g.47799 Transcript_18099/m.47799 type:complete len:240 (+) Transcript_18099:130-849(+)